MSRALVVGPLLSLLLLLHLPVLPAQAAGQVPPRDQPAEAKKGTAVLRGRVTAAETGAPIPRATVSLRSSELKEARGATTDGEGRYEIRDLPGGRFMLSVSPGRFRAMYLGTAGAAPGQGRGGRIVEVADGQILKDVDFAMTRAGAITGRVVDEFGEPMSNVRVTLVASGAGRGASAITSGASTDDLGRFRLFGLEAGSYYVKAEAGLLGTVSVGSPPSSDDYVPTYYPGTPNLAEAPALKLEPSQEAGEIEIRMARGRGYRVTGLVLDVEGRPAANAIIMVSAISQGPLPSMGGVMSKPDGTFELGKVPPGDYAIAARLGADARQASKPVRVSIVSADVENLTLAIVPGATLAGRVVTDNGSVPDFRPSGAVTAFSVDRSTLVMASMLTGTLRDDWSFEITGVRVPVVLRLPARLSEGWRLKSVHYRDADITNVPTEFTENTAASDLTIVLTNRGAKIEGMVLDTAGKPRPMASVTLFPEESSQRFFQSTRVRTTTSDEQGRYNLEGLPAGSYLILSAEPSPLEGAVFPDASIFEPFVRMATRVTLAEAERKTINLRLAKPESR